MDQGFTVVWAGWQHDVSMDATLMHAQLPVTAGITGRSREEIILTPGSGPRQAILAYPAAEPANARLSLRASADAARESPAGLAFRFIDAKTVEITPPACASAGTLYDFTYAARDPVVAGMGLAMLRDVTSFLRHDTTAANPLYVDERATVQRAIGLGISLSARVLRDFIYYGMNQDEQGRIVFEGAMPIIPGACRSFINDRFAQPGRNPGPQFGRLYPVLKCPFTYPVFSDAVSGRTDGILLRCLAPNSCPKVIQMDSEFELWGSQASLVNTNTAGRPIEMPENVWLFLMPATPHGNIWNAVATRSKECAFPLNPNTGAPEHAGEHRWRCWPGSPTVFARRRAATRIALWARWSDWTRPMRRFRHLAIAASRRARRSSNKRRMARRFEANIRSWCQEPGPMAM